MADSTHPVVESRPVLVRFAQKRPLTLFFLLAYAWAWTCFLVVPRLICRMTLGADFDTYDLILILTGACGPTVAALIIRWLADRDLKICRVWTGWRSLATGLACGLGAFFVVTLLAPSAALVKAPVYALHWPALLHWSTYGINYSTFLGGPVQEEPGWRGFALPRLQERYGPVWATLILAPLWAGWHLPLFQVEGWSSASPWQYLLIVVGISFLLTAATNIAKFNVVVAIVLHAFFNTSSGLIGVLTNGLPPRSQVTLIYAFAVFVGGVVVGLALLRLHRRIPTMQPSADGDGIVVDRV